MPLLVRHSDEIGVESHMATLSAPQIYLPTSIHDAIEALGDEHASIIAGATWVMRNAIRNERHDARYVSVTEIPELKAFELTASGLRIGAAVTHAEIADVLFGVPDLYCLWQAAAKSANPAVRAAASLGGNLCAVDFPAPDLVTALLSLGAHIEIIVSEEKIVVPIERFLEVRRNLPRSSIVSAVQVKRMCRLTSHQRLPLRVAGDYPVAIVSVVFNPDRTCEMPITVAVGAVEDVPRRWTSLESCWRGSDLNSLNVKEFALQYANDFNGRESVEAPGWYRTSVLPVLLERAVRDIELQLLSAG